MPEQAGTVGAIVLGAGRSSRFGDRNKLLAPVDGTPMVARVVQVAAESAADDIVAVLGHESARVAEVLADYPVSLLTNDAYAAGQSTSVRCGIEFALTADWDAAVILLGDMPYVGPETVNQLITAYRDAAGPIVVPRYDGQRGNPVVFDRSQFEAVLQVGGDSGARELVRRHPDTAWIDVDDPAVRDDIDTVDDVR